MIERTTLSVDADDLEVFRREAKRRRLSLNSVLREIVHQAADERRQSRPKPHFGVFRGPGDVVHEILENDEAPARGRLRS